MARHRKLEPIRLEDLENNPCASGLEKVLRFEVPVLRDFPAPPGMAGPQPELVSTPVETTGVAKHPVDIKDIESTPVEISEPVVAGDSPACAEPCAVSTPADSTPVQSAPDEVSPAESPPKPRRGKDGGLVGNYAPPVIRPDPKVTSPVIPGGNASTPVDTSVLPEPEPRLFLSRSKKRLFRPLRPEDAHTDGETRLYEFLWQNGRPHAEGVRVYAGSMTTLARVLGRDDRNTRPVVESLIRKLSIAVAREQDYHTGHPRMYFVFNSEEIAARRRRAGLEWAVKNKGIQLLTVAEAAVLAAAEKASTPVEIDPGELTPVQTESNVSTPVAKR
jgi:hypothetical protein